MFNFYHLYFHNRSILLRLRHFLEKFELGDQKLEISILRKDDQMVLLKLDSQVLYKPLEIGLASHLYDFSNNLKNLSLMCYQLHKYRSLYSKSLIIRFLQLVWASNLHHWAYHQLFSFPCIFFLTEKSKIETFSFE